MVLNLHSEFDVIVVGAGVAGSALAYSLATSGRRTLLLERDLSPPDRIVGELLQPGGVAALRALGMGECLEGIDAVPTLGYCTTYEGQQVEIPYPPSPAGKGKKAGQTESGRVEGRAFVHGKFIDALRRKAKSAEDCLVVEATVKELITCPSSTRVIGVSVALRPTPENPCPPAQTSLYAPLTIVADGCFSRFRSPNSPAPVTRSHFVGLVLDDAELPVPRHGNVILGSGHGPVLCYQIGTHETRMLVDVKGKLPSLADGSLLRHLQGLLPHLPACTRPAVERALEESKKGGDKRLRTMPNSWLPARQQGGLGGREGVVVIGDAWNMRHPLTGGGMTVAFHDVLHLSRILAPSSALPDLDDWYAYSDAIGRWHWERKNLSAVVNVLSVALYDLFGAKDENLAVLREGCFKYFQLGGTALSGPVSLLSALAPKPLLLAYHFFSVAFYSIWCLFAHPKPVYAAVADPEKPTASPPKPIKWVRPSPLDYPALAVRSVLVFWTACHVFLPLVWDEIQ